MKKQLSQWLIVLSVLIPCVAIAQAVPEFPGGTYNKEIPTPASVLGFEIGSRPAHHHEAVAYLKKLAEVSPRAEYVEAGYTHENRLLGYLLVSSEKNMAKLEEIKTRMATYSDPRKNKSMTPESTIATAWMMYSIHGDEISGTDAALALAYQLTAGTDKKTLQILDELVVGIDPMENPDGRERALGQIAQYSGYVTNSDAQDMHHTGEWPYGRGNHYFFDLNRDWFILAHPESRARMKALLEWNPVLVVDAHEQGAYDTYLFNPPREPINLNIPSSTRKWWDRFSRDQSAAFDHFQWSYYTRSWYDDLFPGYGSAMPNYWGSVALLYEQAQTDGSVVKQPADRLSSFADAVHHQFISSMANLGTAAENRVRLLEHYAAVRKQALKLDGAYYIHPGDNPTRAERLVDRLLMCGIEVYQTNSAVSRFRGKDREGKYLPGRNLPAGSYVVPLGQPMGILAQAILEFDPRMLDEVLQKEYAELRKGKGSTLYEVSAWSMLLAYDVDAYYDEKGSPKNLRPITDIQASQGRLVEADQAVAFVCAFTDDQAIHALLAMFNKGLNVRAATEPFELGNHRYARGTLLLRANENPANLPEMLAEIARDQQVTIEGLPTMRMGKGPDIGGTEFELLEAPRIGLLAGPSLSVNSVGSIWYVLDYEFRTRISLLNHDHFSGMDLRKYNVLILPGAWGGLQTYKTILGEGGIAKLKNWVRDGGTLIGISDASAFLADTANGFSQVALKQQALDKLDSFTEDLSKRWDAESQIDSLLVWEGRGKPEDAKTASEKTSQQEIKALDEDGRLFHPRGTIMNAILNEEHWLAYGAGGSVPVTIYSSYAFLAKHPVETPARYASAGEIRLSGLMWPEARERWSETAYLTRERLGNGQIILFADEPAYRSYYYGSIRLLLNALVLGPGVGTRVGVDW